jgi:protein O-mannosyl-transferase
VNAPAPSAPAPASRQGRAAVWAAAWPVLGILALGLFAYANSLHGAFAFDDRFEIRDNPVIRDLWGFLAPSGYRSNPNRFVAYASFALNYRLGGLHVVGWHAVNLAIHLCASLLVYALARLCFRTPLAAASPLAREARPVAFLAGVLFATHPLGTQAVTYVVQRLTSLAAMLYLLAVVLYLAWRLADPGRAFRRAAAYAGMLLAALLAVRTKEIAFTLPLALALVEALLFSGRGLRRVLPILPVGALALLIPWSWIGVRAGMARGGASTDPAVGVLAQVAASTDQATRLLSKVSRLDYLRTEAAVVVEYLRLLAFPSGQNLDHDFPVYRSFLAPRVLLSLAILAALAAFAAWAVRATSPARARPADPALRIVALGIGWWFLALSVESSFIPIADVIYEHRAYLPSAGIVLSASVLAGLGWRRAVGDAASRPVVLTALALGLLLGALTLQRNAVWSDPVTLWTDVASKSPNKLRARQNLGESLDAAGRRAEAEREFRAAIAIDPSSVEAHKSLAVVLHKSGRLPEAEVEYREALRLDPRHVPALFNLADLLWRGGRRDEAAALYRRYLEAAPGASGPARSVAETRLQATSPR